jgi:GntP family gluconate:H+ symporter
MDSLIPFAVSLVLITVASVRYHLPPFLTLIGTSIIFGIFSGMPVDTVMQAITQGAGRIFSILGIVIFSGVGIAQVIRESNRIDQIVADIRRLVHRPLYTSGIAGYILSVPLMCGITSFVILSPIVAHLRADQAAARMLLYVAGVAGIISYVLLYPAPVIVSILSTLALFPERPWQIDAITIPLSLLLLLLLLAAARFRLSPSQSEAAPEAEASGRLLAWLPFIVILLMLAVGIAFPPLAPLANINLVLITALVAALASVPGEVRLKALSKGTKNAGIIIFDLAGAGAFGAVIAASTFSADIYALVQGCLPAFLLPFVIAALIQAAQGSRVVTAAVTSSILTATPITATISPTVLVLMICAGAFMFSYVSDPFFWLMKRTTGDDFAGTVIHYTLPLSAAGALTLVAGLLLQAALP